MKTSRMILCAAAFAVAFAAGAGSAGAGEKTAPAQSKPSQSAGRKAKPARQTPEKVLGTTTGSRIPQRTIVHGQITTTASELVVIDNDAIQRSGASDVADLLRRGGWASVHR